MALSRETLSQFGQNYSARAKINRFAFIPDPVMRKVTEITGTSARSEDAFKRSIEEANNGDSTKAIQELRRADGVSTGLRAHVAEIALYNEATALGILGDNVHASKSRQEAKEYRMIKGQERVVDHELERGIPLYLQGVEIQQQQHIFTVPQRSNQTSEPLPEVNN